MAEDSQAAIRGLSHAARFLRMRLGQNMRIRYIPRLEFIEDRTERDAARMERLIDEVRTEDQRRHREDEDGA